jgi:hypothetical protein
MAGEWSLALFLFGAGNEKSTGCILGKSCGHTIYWGLGDRYDTGDISNLLWLRLTEDSCLSSIKNEALKNA